MWIWVLHAAIVACSGEKERSVDSAVDTAQTTTEDTADVDLIYRSNRRSQHQSVYSFDSRDTLGNPMKGFLTSYQWSEPHSDFPHSLEFLYLPLSSLVQGPEVYSFETGLEPYLNQSAARNNHLLLRVYIDYPSLETGLPEYLRDVVSCEAYSDHGGGCSPDYDDPQLQNTILKFISALGQRYDGDRRIAFIQLGLLGFWGEWHTWPHSEWFADDEFQLAVISAYDDAFDQTPLQIRYPRQDSAARDIGFHDDSFAYSTVGSVNWFFWSLMEAANATERWKQVPIGGEVYPALQSTLFSEAYEVGEYSQNPLEAVQTTHASYLLNYFAFSGNETGYQGDQRTSAEETANALGYQYAVEEVTVDVFNLEGETIDVQFQIQIRNYGVAPFYYPLELQLYSSNDSDLWFVSEVSTLLPDTEATVFTLLIEDMSIESVREGFSLKLHSDWLFEARPIQWANAEQNNGRLDVNPTFVCELAGEVFSLGEAVVQAEQTCVCDVDGTLYTLTGEVCVR